MTHFSRRSFLQSAALSGLAIATRDAWSSPTPDSSSKGLTQFVDVFIGTGGHGHTFPGATVPFGMVQLSPDTGVGDWDHCSGYHISDTSIMGFSHTHLSGTGGAVLRTADEGTADPVAAIKGLAARFPKSPGGPVLEPASFTLTAQAPQV